MSVVAGAEEAFFRMKHLQYFMVNARELPEDYLELDTNRITILYFAVVGLDLLNSLHVLNREQCIDYVYQLQLPTDGMLSQPGRFGFIGGTFMGHNLPSMPSSEYIEGHLAMIYTALIILLTLDDDLARIDRAQVREGNCCICSQHMSFSHPRGTSNAKLTIL